MSIKNHNNKPANQSRTAKKSMTRRSQLNDPRDQLVAWAHEGTLESMNKISDFMDREKDSDLIGFAQCACDEASYNYYSPKNETEEKDFVLSKMIHDRELRIDELQIDLMSADLRNQRMEIDKEIHTKIMKSNPKNNLWEYRLSADFLTMALEDPKEIQDDIDYEVAWIDEAKKSIKTKRYYYIPSDVLESVHLDGEFDDEAREYCQDVCDRF